MYKLYSKDYMIIFLAIISSIITLFVHNIPMFLVTLLILTMYLGNKISLFFVVALCSYMFIHAGSFIYMLWAALFGYYISMLYYKVWYEKREFTRRIHFSEGSTIELNDSYRTAAIMGIFLGVISVLFSFNISLPIIILSMTSGLSSGFQIIGAYAFVRLNKNGAYLFVIGLVFKIMYIYMQVGFNSLIITPIIILIIMSILFIYNERA